MIGNGKIAKKLCVSLELALCMGLGAVSANAANLKININSRKVGRLKEGDDRTYVLKITKTSKVKITFALGDDQNLNALMNTIEDVGSDSDDELADLDFPLDDSDDFDDSDEINWDLIDADPYADMDVEADEDIEDIEDSEEEEDDDSDYDDTALFSMYSKNGKKDLISEEIEAGNSFSKVLTLKAGIYYIDIDNGDSQMAYQLLIKNTAKTAKSIKLNKKKATLKVPKSLKLKASPKKKGELVENVTWKSSNKKIAVVNKKGKVVAKKTGKCTITAQVKGGKAAKCLITVKK